MAKTVLVVDDSAVIRASVRFTLEKAGYEVVEAGDGSAGLTALQEMTKAGKKPGMILTDINMPIMDGITFIIEAKKLAEHKFTPILVFTTESQDDKKQQGKAAGASGWLVKPFKDEQMIGVVKKFLP